MTSEASSWTKKELHLYIFLMCANADSEESEEEIALIKSKTDEQTFEKIYKEFSEDSEDERFEKIEDGVHQFHYSNMELIQLRKQMTEIFEKDKKYTLREQNLDRILDNLLY
ncbi:hypothetical protein [Aegicerativicinus sediminis]|uniref:hypothetical protein n=1 Tax=Aegicerativicinus sediminis TaxID=2893202 RepID=UPI001E313AD8|nr:hypothetical protein [Aegicerativicinus sediminis]